MPGLYLVDEYDLAGFEVGIVDEKNLITGKELKAGDILFGIQSSGIHSNGYSLVRKVFTMTETSLRIHYDSLGTTLGEALLTPTKIYVEALRKVKEEGITIKGCSHITGGGFYENIPRMLPDGVRAIIEKKSYSVPAIFQMLSRDGDIKEEMMYNTFNMGVGMVLGVADEDVDRTIAAIKAAGETAFVLGQIEAGEKGVTLC